MLEMPTPAVTETMVSPFPAATSKTATTQKSFATLPDKAGLLRELAPFAQPSNAKGLALFAQEYLMYWGAIGLMLFAPSMTVKILASIFAGFKLTAFYTLGHDAGHQTLVANKRLNWWLAQLLSIPAWQNHRLWILDHHLLHHPKTNGEQHDFYKPYSKAEFDELSRPAQLFERFVRAPNLVGFGVNFFFTWLLATRLFPTRAVPPQFRRSAWRHCAAVLAYQLAFIAFLYFAPLWAPVSAAMALGLGFFLPLVIFAIVTGASLYLMHTHQRLPWFKGTPAREGVYAPTLCAMHMTLPAPLHKFIHNVFAHSAHHAHAGVPVYHLLDAQLHLDRVLGDAALVVPMSLPGAIATMRACKLYDYDKHQWLDFNGKPTTAAICLTARGSKLAVQ